MAHDQGETPTIPWFSLDRHDDEDPPAADENPADDAEPAPDADEDAAEAAEEPDKGPNTAEWKKRSRQWEKRAKENAEKAKRFDELEAAKKSTEERLAEEKSNAEKRADAAMRRAVRAEIAAIAADQFADPSDAVAVLDAAEFVDGDDVNTDAIREQLADLLASKPHWAKPKAEDPKPPKPRPDPSQGARGDAPKLDYRTASRDDVAAQAAKYGLRLKSS
jgi:hypothetical protein